MNEAKSQCEVRTEGKDCVMLEVEVEGLGFQPQRVASILRLAEGLHGPDLVATVFFQL
jgi:hypothetical protein